LEPASLPEADRLAIRAAQLFGTFLFLELGVASWADDFKGSKSAAGSMVVEIISASVVIAGTVIVTRIPLGNRFYRLADYGFRRDMIVPSLFWGVGGFLAVIPLASIGIMVGQLFERFAPRPDHPLIHMLEDSHNLLFAAGAFFLASIQAPFTEELLFRGTLTPALSGLFGTRKYAVPLAIGISSLAFASIHPQGFTLWLSLASIGVVNGVLCYQTRSVLPGMVMHALFNGSVLAYTLLIH
jgi:membrane protease YdiL (CAAX protease family)